MASCGVCEKVFRGENAWEERMEHVGKHFERGEGSGSAAGAGAVVAEDTYLTEWAVREGIVRDLGQQGKWLVGIEPDDTFTPAAPVAGGRGAGRSSGRRSAAAAAAPSAIKSEEDDDDDDDED